MSMSTIKEFQQNEILKAEDMNNIGNNINELNNKMQYIPHSTAEYPSCLKVGEGLEFDIDYYNNQTLFGRYNSAAPDAQHYLLFAIGDGVDGSRSNVFELVKKVEIAEGDNAYDIRIGGISLMNKLDSIITKLDNIATSINGTGNANALTKKYEELATQLAYINTLEEAQEAMRIQLTNDEKDTQEIVNNLHEEYKKYSEDHENQLDTISVNISDIRTILYDLINSLPKEEVE